MNAVIDLGSELIINPTSGVTPEFRLLLAAIGCPIVEGSPWVVVSKCVAALYPFPPSIFAQGKTRSARACPE